MITPPLPWSSAWSPVPHDYSQFYGWGMPNGSLANAESMVVQPVSLSLSLSRARARSLARLPSDWLCTLQRAGTLPTAAWCDVRTGATMQKTGVAWRATTRGK